MLFEAFNAEQLCPNRFVCGNCARVAHLEATAIAETHGLSPRMVDWRTDIGEFYYGTGRAQPGILSHT
jgi:hypothetical protein